MNQVEFDSQLNFQEYVRASFYINYRRPVMIVISLLGAIFLVLSVLNFAGFEALSIAPMMQFGFGLYFLLFLPILIYFRCYRQFNAKNRFTENIRWIIDHEWISLKGESFETKMKWDKIYEVVETKDVFLIYQSKVIASMVTKRSLSDAQLQGLRSIIRGVLDIKHKLLSN